MEQRYRDAVWTAVDGDGPAEPDGQLLDDAGRMLADLRNDIARARNRVKLVNDRTVKIPEAAEKAAAARKIADQAKALVNRPIDQTPTTLAQLAAEFQAFSNQPLKLTNLTGLGELIVWFAQAGVMELRMNAMDRESGVRDGLQSVQQRLYETGSVEVHREIDKLRGEIHRLHEKINSRKRILDAPAEIERLQSAIEQLSREPRPDDVPYGVSPVQYVHEEHPLTYRERYNVARQQLVALQELAAGRDQAMADNQRDQEAIGALQEQMSALQERLLTEPRLMRWSGEGSK